MKHLLKLKSMLPSVFELSFAFNKFTLGEWISCKELGITEDDIDSYDFNLLTALGFSKQEIASANDYVCGTMTIEGAPFLQTRTLPCFRLC